MVGNVHSRGSKNMRNVIQMALKCFFQKSQKSPSDWYPPSPEIPVCDAMELHQFAQHASRLRHFSNREIFTFKVDLHSIRFSCFRTFFLLHKIICSFSPAFLYAHISINQIVAYWEKVFRKKFL